jgi:hypothetical protein
MGWGKLVRVAFLLAVSTAAIAASPMIPNLFNFADPAGAVATLHVHGAIDQNNAFFQDLGTNGRTCATCHVVDNALSLSASTARSMFAGSHGTDPLFADVDGSNCPGAAPGDAAAHSLLLDHGLFRIALPVPDNAQFTVQTVYDPYGCADYPDPVTGERTLSMYRRPQPATNLRFLSAVMFDGRETAAPLNDPATFGPRLEASLRHQALDATLGHAQAAVPPSDAQLDDIVNFELNLYSAQSWDATAGPLQAHGASGGPMTLAGEPYYPGINDSLGGNPTGAAFDPQAFTLFTRWTDDGGRGRNGAGGGLDAEQQAAIAAGEALFNSAPLTITGVAGLNDALGVAAIPGTCSTCHDTPNVGDHSMPVPLDIGVSHVVSFESDTRVADALAKLNEPDVPIFKITCTSGDPGRTVFTTDPARALITGQCADLTRGKGPILRGLSARAPYFHNGSAATLRDVVEFYNQRFDMNLTEEQKAQLTAFLAAL